MNDDKTLQLPEFTHVQATKSVPIWRAPGRVPTRQRGNSTQIIATDIKPGQNAPCPCGSGKKFKKCCGGVCAVEHKPFVFNADVQQPLYDRSRAAAELATLAKQEMERRQNEPCERRQNAESANSKESVQQ